MSRPVPLTPELVVQAYCQGIFPMAHGRGGPIGWYSPDPRGILPLDAFHVPRNLRKRVRRGEFHITFDQAFDLVMRRCAEPRSYENQTWISDQIIDTYCALHRMGLAHSVEAWSRPADGEPALVGGLYGVSIRGAFFGESMFSRATDASKVCLVHLVEHLRTQGFLLLDTQFSNHHLEQFGVTEIPRDAFLDLLGAALTLEVGW